MASRELTANEREHVEKLIPIHRETVASLLVAQQDILDKLRKNRRNTATGTVYHYTGQLAMEGITQRGSLWLSDYTTMPDKGEISWAFNVGMEIVRDAYEDGPKTGRLTRFVGLVEKIAKKPLNQYFHAYILSLTPNGEVAGQWQLYADQSAGYCLGFDSRILDRAFVAFTKTKGLMASGSYKVLYDERRLRSLMQEYVTNALDAVISISEYRPAYNQSAAKALYEIGVNLVFAFIFTALFFKHPGYSAENEYRYIIMTLPKRRGIPALERRTHRGRKVTYFEFDWKNHAPCPLKQIKIGPAQSERKGRSIVAKALKRARLTPDVVMSTMPIVRHA